MSSKTYKDNLEKAYISGANDNQEQFIELLNSKLHSLHKGFCCDQCDFVLELMEEMGENK